MLMEFFKQSEFFKHCEILIADITVGSEISHMADIIREKWENILF